MFSLYVANFAPNASAKQACVNFAREFENRQRRTPGGDQGDEEDDPDGNDWQEGRPEERVVTRGTATIARQLSVDETARSRSSSETSEKVHSQYSHAALGSTIKAGWHQQLLVAMLHTLCAYVTRALCTARSHT